MVDIAEYAELQAFHPRDRDFVDCRSPPLQYIDARSDTKLGVERARNTFRNRALSPPPQQTQTTTNPPRTTTIDVIDARDVKMLAKATKAFQDHMKDMTEKTKGSCCAINNKHAEKENINQQQQQNYLNQMNCEPVKYIVDRCTDTTYVRGKLLGKGGFAKCYELTCVATGKKYAGKIISKNRIAKPHQRDKIAREVELHRHLKHDHVVGFHSYFEDEENVYIVLEICSRKSLVHVLRNRKTLTEPEVRFHLRHLVEGCKYIHKHKIIHRDLKLGNMLLNENMHVKIADFGLATKVQYDGEKKMTVCGTPNYIAPEVLQKKGHSYEADIWAIGCIMYALLVGRPPFETSTLKETYMRITANKFHIPSHISQSARQLIQKLLGADPASRPTLEGILEQEFFSSGYSPKALSTTCCETAPKFPPYHIVPNNASRPKSFASPVTAGEAMMKITSSLAQLKAQKRSNTPSPVRPVSVPKTEERQAPSPIQEIVKKPTPRDAEPHQTTPSQPREHRPRSRHSSQGSNNTRTSSSSSTKNTNERSPPSTDIKALPFGSAIRMYQMLSTCLEQMPEDANPTPVDNVKPLWVTKWVDYSNKYGFGFQLSDKSVGVHFNDTTRMLLSADGKTAQYNDLSNKVYTFTTDAPPKEYRKKSTLLLYFAQYMDEHLIHGGDIFNQKEEQIANSIFMKKWFRTGKAIVMYLNNGTLQVNFFEDHTKVILSPDTQDYLVTFINSQRQAVTYRLLQLRHFGCSPDISERIMYARTMLESIINIEGETV